MFRSMLFLHWKQIRWGLAPMVVAAFALPLMTVGSLGATPGMDTVSLEAYRIVSTTQIWVLYFPALAGAIGMALALSSWNWDHQHNHIYALSLPTTRWEYTLRKLLAGFTLATLPALGLWLGAHVAAASVSLPPGLQAYPNELSVRFLFAICLSYGLLFALAAGTKKTAITLVSAALAFVFLGTMANDYLAEFYPYFQRNNVVAQVTVWFVSLPGPLEVFTGSWALIDV